jgi:hypothetical protein
LGLATAIFSIYIYGACRKKHFSLDLWSIFLFIFLLAASLQSRRNFPLFFFVSLEFIIIMAAAILPRMKLDSRWAGWWLKSCLLICLGSLTLASAVQINRVEDPFIFFGSAYPRDAVRFLKNHTEYEADNIFNEYGWGGYLIWAYPERKLFIDGRLPQVELNGHSFLEEYLDFFGQDTDRAAKLARYDVHLVLLKAEDQDVKAAAWEKFVFNIKDSELKAKNYLREYLDKNSDWQKIYSDQTAVIYSKIN